MSGFRFEDYRQPWETGPHWELKREFMEKYVDMFPEDRLLCLAQAYSNVVLMNCTYPAPVMEQISHLAKPLQMRKKFQGEEISSDNEDPEQSRIERAKLLYAKSGKTFKQVKFCSSNDGNTSEQLCGSINENKIYSDPNISRASLFSQQELNASNSIATEVLNNETPFKKIKLESGENVEHSNQGMAEVKVEKGNSTIDVLGIKFIQEFAQKLRTFQIQGTNEFQQLMTAANNLKVDKDIITEITPVPNRPAHSPMFCCKIWLKNCLISSATEKSKKYARWKSARVALDNLTNMAIGSSVTSETLPLASSDETSVTLPGSTSNLCTSNLSKTLDVSSYLQIPEEDYNILKTLFKHLVKEPKNQFAFFTNILRKLKIEKFFDLKRNIIPIKNQPKAYPIQEFFIIYKGIEISTEKAPLLKYARNTACERAYNILEKLDYCMISNGKLIVTECQTNFYEPPKPQVINTPNIFNKMLFDASLRDGFVLLDNLNNISRCYKTVLPDSASFCRKNFKNEVEVTPGTSDTKVTVFLDGNIVMTANGSSKEDAKSKALFYAVEFLRKKYYTIQIKYEFEDCFKVSREYAYSLSGKNDALTDNNIGCKMLKTMGWSGGGLGTAGISEPVGLDTQHNFKKGLGFDNPTENLQEFKQKITPLLQDLKTSKSLGHLVFSKDFTKDERKLIHGIAQRFGLNSASRGKDIDRFLVVRRKYTVKEVLQHLFKVGGSDNKFQLLDASIDELNPFKIDSE